MMKKIICNLFIAVMVAMLASPQAGAQIVTVDGQRQHRLRAARI